MKPYSPFYRDMNLLLPRDRREVNAWSRHYYAVNPHIGSYIDGIVALVSSGFKIHCDSQKELVVYRNAFFDYKDNKLVFKHADVCDSFVKELNLSGEVFTHIMVNESKLTVTPTILNPDFVELRKLGEGVEISLIPDDELRRMVSSKKPQDIKLAKSLDATMVSRIKQGKNIILSPVYVKHIAMKSSPYDIRGTSRLVKYFKALMYEDRIIEQAFELNLPKPDSVFVTEAIRKEINSKPFENSLEKQRQILEDYLISSVFGAFKKINNLKTSVRISWNEEVDVTEMKRNWN